MICCGMMRAGPTLQYNLALDRAMPAALWQPLLRLFRKFGAR
jgi:hypothetical protein